MVIAPDALAPNTALAVTELPKSTAPEPVTVKLAVFKLMADEEVAGAKPCVPAAMVSAVPSAVTEPRLACPLASLLVRVAVAKLVSVKPPVKCPVTPDALLSFTAICTALSPALPFFAMMAKSLV